MRRAYEPRHRRPACDGLFLWVAGLAALAWTATGAPLAWAAAAAFPSEHARELAWSSSLAEGIRTARAAGKPICLVLAGRRPSGDC